MKETDLPCSDCGATLEERTVDARELPVAGGSSAQVRLAVCPACGARYYPNRTLARLSDAEAERGREARSDG